MGSRLAKFGLALVVVTVLILGWSLWDGPTVEAKPSGTTEAFCPATACPLNHSGYTHIGHCNRRASGGTQTCQVWQNDGNGQQCTAYESCGYW